MTIFQKTPHANRHAIFILLVAGFSCSVPVSAGDAPAWTQQDVIMATIQIRMSVEQQTEFREVANEYLKDMRDMIEEVAVLDTNDPAGVIVQRNMALVTAMDKQMAAILDDEQMKRYFVYRDTLQDHLF